MHWVGKEDSLTAEIREYGRLFTAEFPGKKTGNFLDDVDYSSKKIFNNSKISKGFVDKIKKDSRW